MTRTVFVGYIPEETKKIYDLVLKNQLLTEKEYKDGGNAKLISRMVDNDFNLHGYNLIHALGHGVGLDIHEIPIVSPKMDFVLKEKMVITNEPGIYIPGKFGIRIEDTVLIGKDSCECLTKSSKEYTIVDKK